MFSQEPFGIFKAPLILYNCKHTLFFKVYTSMPADLVLFLSELSSAESSRRFLFLGRDDVAFFCCGSPASAFGVLRCFFDRPVSLNATVTAIKYFCMPISYCIHEVLQIK